MMHRNRIFNLSREDFADRLEELAAKISESGNSWTSCTAWKVGPYILANDQTCEDGAGEWAVLKDDGGPRLRQIESVTFGWCSTEKALGYLREMMAGAWDGMAYGDGYPRAQFVGLHAATCELCA